MALGSLLSLSFLGLVSAFFLFFSSFQYSLSCLGALRFFIFFFSGIEKGGARNGTAGGHVHWVEDGGGVAWAVHVWEVVAMCKRWYMSR